MTIDFKDFSEDFLKEEKEKAQFGGEIYANHHKLPEIFITENNKSLYEYHIEMIEKMCDVGGQELSIIFGTIVKLYKIDDNLCENNNHTPIIHACLKTIANQSLALNQSKELLNYIRSNNGDPITLLINGAQYCFIAKMLMNVFSDFSSLFSLIVAKNYLSRESIDFIREKMIFLISPEVETLRQAFKVIECYECLDAKPMLH